MLKYFLTHKTKFNSLFIIGLQYLDENNLYYEFELSAITLYNNYLYFTYLML